MRESLKLWRRSGETCEHNEMKKRARLNCQAMARRDPLLMKCIVPLDGHVFVSVDLTSGEPSVTSEYSKDTNYIYACFGGIGKVPYYENGLLMCDDIYVMNMSKSPLHAQLVRDTFDNFVHEGRNFQEQWLVDKEVITKKRLGKARETEKMLCIAEGSLVRIRGSGWIPIERVAFADCVWDGLEYVSCSGAIYKGESYTECYEGVWMTPNHKIKTNGGWRAVVEAFEVSKCIVRGSDEPCPSWSELWSMVRNLRYCRTARALSICVRRLWAWRNLEVLR